MPARHLYIHVPFCTRRCSYCDFSIAVRRVVPVVDYLRGVSLELLGSPAAPGNTGTEPGEKSLETVYLGGGTPSRLGANGIARLLHIVRSNFEIARGAEITIEANPEDISRESVSSWIAAGVNRLSIGLQSFDNRVLGWMHRVHDADEGIRAFHSARAAGMGNISVDLIFALPAELNRSWESDLRAALDLEPEHISLYGLTVEPATPLARWQERGIVSAADEGVYAEEFLMADEMALARGFRHYEVSNFALPGRESRHNSGYWTGASYLGLGPSAHSFDGEKRSWNVPAYAEWLRKLDAGESPMLEEEHLTPANRDSERVYLGLRTANGLAASKPDLTMARRWKRAGWAQIDKGVVRLTPEGWLRLDSLASGLAGF